MISIYLQPNLEGKGVEFMLRNHEGIAVRVGLAPNYEKALIEIGDYIKTEFLLRREDYE